MTARGPDSLGPLRGAFDGRSWMRVVFAAVFLVFALTVQAAADGQGVVLYRIGEGGQEALDLLAKSLAAKSYIVDTVQGETDIDKHVEKVSRINRGAGAVFVALEIVPAEKSRAMVAEAAVRKGEGRFLSITEISSRFSEQSDRLAGCVASSFGAKVVHLPLFPLLGVSMPAIAVKLELKPDDTAEAISRLTGGIEKYFSERTGK